MLLTPAPAPQERQSAAAEGALRELSRGLQMVRDKQVLCRAGRRCAAVEAATSVPASPAVALDARESAHIVPSCAELFHAKLHHSVMPDELV